MATNKKPVTSYLPDDLEKQLTKYCESKGLVRDYKDGETKPQLGTAIVEILESFFGMDSEVSSPPPDQISELKGLIYNLTHRVEQLESSVSNVPDTVPSNGLSKVEDNGESNESSVSNVPDTVPSNGLPSSHTQSELAKRLRVTTRTIANNLKRGSLEKANKFCEKYDRYYWQWHEQNKLFYPQLERLMNQ